MKKLVLMAAAIVAAQAADTVVADSAVVAE